MPVNQFKRHIAYKFRIGDILTGKPIFNGEKFSFLEFEDKKIVRVNIVGNIVDKYESSGDKRYIFFTLDDGSGQIKMKSFGDDAEKFKDFSQGKTIVAFGILKYFNNEVYISPEILKEHDPRYLLVRKLELEKNKSRILPAVKKEQIIAVKDKILEEIKNSNNDSGIEFISLIIKLKDVPEVMINQEILKLIEEGIIFEPRPGRLKWLG